MRQGSMAGRHRPRAALAAATLGIAALSGTAHAQGQGTLQDLGNLSLQDLGKVVVTSVAKNPESLAEAPAAIYVITHEEIMRSGARSLPEILRLAPNLGVFQLSPSNYIVTSRGLSGNQSGQNFPNKLLVLIDGRSVYSPLFSGIYWDQQFVLPEDIERIEVISGPAGALWGANAVNGVINIITRSAADTQGGTLQAGWGNQGAAASVQYGGQLGDNAWYRIYAHDFQQRSFDAADGRDARDGWGSPQAGFRIDWKPDNSNVVTLQGDILKTREGERDHRDVRASSGNVLARWSHEFDSGSTFRLRAYFESSHSGPSAAAGGGALKTWDIEAQQDFALADRHHITWGIGDRAYSYRLNPGIGPAVSLLWNPSSGTRNLANAFVQDQVIISQRTQVTLGLKAEHDPYSGLSWMPSLRWSFKPNDNWLLWAAASRAIRSPAVFDRDVVEIANTPSGPLEFLRGNPDYKTEKLVAWEAGMRTHSGIRTSLSVSLYYNDYRDLRAIDFTPVTGFPYVFGNGMRGHTYGVDAWGSYAPTDWWRLGAGLSLERERMRVRPGAGGGPKMAGDDPSHRAFVRSSMNLGDHWMLDIDVRKVGSLPDPRLPGYVECNARVAWSPGDRLQLSLSGMNLLHAWHQEYPDGDRIPRTFFLDARLKF